MDTPLQTTERLRTWLNSNQVSRERLCLAVLTLDRNYTDAQPRRPEGGRDGKRDIQCYRNGQLCFGAVGFRNNANDSSADKRWVKNKFKEDLTEALATESELKAFVFFTNVDLTPAEKDDLVTWGNAKDVTFVDIYWRERIRHALDTPAGLALRFQYLSIPLSEAEQASFFSHYGLELENLVTGRFDSIENKVERLELVHWKSGMIREMQLRLELKKLEHSFRQSPEHFRALLDLQDVNRQIHHIVFGGRDEFWKANESQGGYYFGTKTFLWRKRDPRDITPPPPPSRMGGGHVSAYNFGISWYPKSDIPVVELEGLSPFLHVTENLVDRIASVHFIVDDYELLNVDLTQVERARWHITHDCTEPLTPSEQSIGYIGFSLPFMSLSTLPPKYNRW